MRESVREKSRPKEREEKNSEREELWRKDGTNGKEVVRGSRRESSSGAEKEVRKGFPPPAAMSHGHRNPTRYPKSILKKADANQLGQGNGIPI